MVYPHGKSKRYSYYHRNFDKYFNLNYFKRSEEKLIENRKDVLIYEVLRKNEYQDRQTTEIIIKSDKYIEFLRSRKDE